ncbi:hypothetical protein [Pontibacter liquoris]|uniref:hypothetical protein n=1 Tax=Pontibacter liquoris TaxID=2905677 RepID=UPI001FA7E90F|nr:hypothetical protein [Pontibacter liquoris]
MKKIITSFLCVAAATALALPSQAQITARNKYLNAGIGIGAYTAGGIPIGASLEVDIKNNISAGGFVDYARYGYKAGGYSWHYNFVYFGARGSYHLIDVLSGNEASKWDPYAGVSVGVRTAWYSDNQSDTDFESPYAGGVFAGIHVGSRYMFTDKVGAFAEVGYGVTALRLGVAAKF